MPSTASLLETVAIDWSDFKEAGVRSRDLLQHIADDRAFLEELIESARADEKLRKMCQVHRELAYLVIYDCLERGIRLRVHSPTVGEYDLPHDHRFSFSSHVLVGEYRHTIYERESGNEPACQNWSMAQAPGSLADGVVPENLRFSGLNTLWATVQTPGSSYSLHHSTIHTTLLPEEKTFTLFVRGPAEKPASLILEPEYRRYWWKYGAANESQVQADRASMSDEYFDAFVYEMRSAQVI